MGDVPIVALADGQKNKSLPQPDRTSAGQEMQEVCVRFPGGRQAFFHAGPEHPGRAPGFWGGWNDAGRDSVGKGRAATRLFGANGRTD